MRNVIPFNDIPDGVKHDLAKFFGTVSYKYYGDEVTQDCTSLRSNFTHILEENVQRMDPLSQTMKTGSRQIGFIVRGEFTSNKKIEVYAVVASGEVFVPAA